MLTVVCYGFLHLVVGAPFPDSVQVNLAIMAVLAVFAFIGAHRNERRLGKGAGGWLELSLILGWTIEQEMISRNMGHP